MRLIDVNEYFRKGHGTIDDSAGAAVAMLLKEDEGDLKVLLVKRATRSSDPWSGHMAFPGGRRSVLDADLRETVVRETFEETSIDLGECLLLGTLNALNSTVVPNMSVMPFVFVCEGTPEVTLNEELCAHYWVSLDKLRESKGTAKIKWRDSPSYFIAGEAVWGLTYRMLEHFFSLMSGA